MSTDLLRKKMTKDREFFETYFHAVCNSGYCRIPERSAPFLTYDDGALELMHRPELEDQRTNPSSDRFVHIAFRTGRPEAVDALSGRLNRLYGVASGPSHHRGRNYESCILDLESNQIELTV